MRVPSEDNKADRVYVQDEIPGSFCTAGTYPGYGPVYRNVAELMNCTDPNRPNGGLFLGGLGVSLRRILKSCPFLGTVGALGKEHKGI